MSARAARHGAGGVSVTEEGTPVAALRLGVHVKRAAIGAAMVACLGAGFTGARLWLGRDAESLPVEEAVEWIRSEGATDLQVRNALIPLFRVVKERIARLGALASEPGNGHARELLALLRTQIEVGPAAGVISSSGPGSDLFQAAAEGISAIEAVLRRPENANLSPLRDTLKSFLDEHLRSSQQLGATAVGAHGR